jgi:hypothetical protein
VALAASVGLAVALAPRTYLQPFGPRVEPATVAPLAPSVIAMLLGFALSNRMSALERVTSARLRLPRALWGAALLAATAGAAQCVALVAPPAWRLVVARNGLGLAGLALLSAVLFGARLAWPPILVYTAATLLAGRDPATSAVLPWALLLAPADSTVALAVAAMSAALGLVGYAAFDSRPASGVARE